MRLACLTSTSSRCGALDWMGLLGGACCAPSTSPAPTTSCCFLSAPLFPVRTMLVQMRELVQIAEVKPAVLQANSGALVAGMH